MTDPTEYILAICILAAIVALGGALSWSNERVRRATLEVRDVARDYALADLAIRRDQARRSFNFGSQEECLRTLEQIAFDAAKKRREFTSAAVAPGSEAALIATSRIGETYVFTPSAKTYLSSHPVSWRRVVERYTIDGLSSSPFVVEELEAVARWHGLSALPRTENWSLLVLPPEDYSLLPKQGLAHWLRFRRS